MSKKIEIKEQDFERLVTSVDQLTAAVKMLIDARLMVGYPVLNYSSPPQTGSYTPSYLYPPYLYPQSNCGGNLQNDDGTHRAQPKDY